MQVIQLIKRILPVILILCALIPAQAQRTVDTSPTSGFGISQSSDAASGPTIDLDVASGTHDDGREASIVLHPNPASRYISVVVTGVTSGNYQARITKYDGTPVRIWTMEVVDGIPGIIDIEKVETGIYTFELDVASETLAVPFLKL